MPPTVQIQMEIRWGKPKWCFLKRSAFRGIEQGREGRSVDMREGKQNPDSLLVSPLSIYSFPLLRWREAHPLHMRIIESHQPRYYLEVMCIWVYSDIETNNTCLHWYSSYKLTRKNGQGRNGQHFMCRATIVPAPMACCNAKIDNLSFLIPHLHFPRQIQCLGRLGFFLPHVVI